MQDNQHVLDKLYYELVRDDYYVHKHKGNVLLLLSSACGSDMKKKKNHSIYTISGNATLCIRHSDPMELEQDGLSSASLVALVKKERFKTSTELCYAIKATDAQRQRDKLLLRNWAAETCL